VNVEVAGAGVIGLTCAWALTEAGYDVTVYDPAPGTGATYAAAGMVAPAGEAWFGEESLLRLGLASAALWPDLAARLEVGFARTGALLVGRDASDLATVRRSADLLARHGVLVEEPDVHGLEPTLSDRVVGGLHLPTDGHVNPREVTAALLRRLGRRVVASRAPGTGDFVVRCTGTAAHPAIRPVRGEILRVRTQDPPSHVVRGVVRGRLVYLVPRADGEVVIGATSEHHEGRPVPTVGGVLQLLEDARELVPSLWTAEVLEVLARDRPGTADNGPMIGRIGHREVIAAGHYRGGVLLAPITAAAVVSIVNGTDPPAEVLPFHPSRFHQEVPA
jgi:glycine oxidase